jgi:hypothetical protein
MRILRIDGAADKLKIFQTVVCLIAIPMVNLPCSIVSWKTMEGQFHNTMHVPLLLSQKDCSVA